MVTVKSDRQDKDPDKPSKSQRKREANELQQLGASLLEVKPTLLDKFPLPDELRDAVVLARATPQGSARKRQIQYIGKLMRQIDPAPIEAALKAARGRSYK